MKKVAVVGATGYVGVELVKILHNHPEVKLCYLVSKSYVDQPFSEVYPSFLHYVDIDCSNEEYLTIAKEVDVMFFALPHKVSASVITEELLQYTKVIDLSADYRFDSIDIYEEWYQKHPNKELNSKSIYGLPELKKDIATANLIGNPGCYTTCSILSLAPIMNKRYTDNEKIIINAASGVTGAGRKAVLPNIFTEVNESYKPYGVASHRHTPEIEQELSILSGKDIKVTFTPHLLPINRGILVTIYVPLISNIKENELLDLYKQYYQDKPFVRVKNELPEIKHVKGTNFMDISLRIDSRTKTVIIVGAIDNLIKGAAGQAVQNMNILFGYEETKGLILSPIYP